MTPALRSQRIKRLALDLGFTHVGVAPLRPTPNAGYYRDWLAAGHAGTMRYLGRNRELRENPADTLPGARFAICVSLNYRRPAGEAKDVTSDLHSPGGRIAQYARGRDYHRVMREMLDSLVSRIRDDLREPFDARVFVDTGPIFERELAAFAGIGWIGKNTLLVHPRDGSFTFLGEVFCTLDLAPDTPMTDHCGTCSRCLDACPTQAFPAPYRMDASRCVSYLTIEHREEIPPELAGGVGDWVYGCDVCQDVCPFNAKSPPTDHPQLLEERLPARIPLEPLLTLRSGAWKRLTRETAARRAGAALWRRNAAVALRNRQVGNRRGVFGNLSGQSAG